MPHPNNNLKPPGGQEIILSNAQQMPDRAGGSGMSLFDWIRTTTFWLDCRIPGPLIYISLNKNITIVIYLVLQSTPTHVNKWAGYAIAPTFYTTNMYVVMSNQHWFKAVSQIIRVHDVWPKHYFGLQVHTWVCMFESQENWIFYIRLKT